MSAPAFLPRFASLKWRMANNHIQQLRSHMWVHLAVGLVVLLMLIGGGTALFQLVFDFLMRQEPFGPPLMDRLVRMVLLIFFSMLVFSNFVIMLTTTYISKEVEFLMAQPIGHRRLFFAKLFESMIYSSWAFVVLSFPFFVALGRSRELGWTFFAGAAGLILPYLLIPATIGAVLALLITALFPPRKMLRLAGVLALVGVAAALISQHIFQFQRMLGPMGEGELVRLMRMVGIGDAIGLPSSWLGRGLHALEVGQWGEAAFWSLTLWSTAAMGLVVCDWFAGPLYYRGWCNARRTNLGTRSRRGGLYGMIDRASVWLPRRFRALVTKDFTIFWRDPAQWGQLMILVGVLLIYLLNLRSAAGMGNYRLFEPFWQSIISMFNIGTTGFVLSILTTRFIYPMLSLEGKQQWVIGLAPLGRTHLVWEKFSVSLICALGVTLPLGLLSSVMLRADGWITALTLITVIALSLGLSSLSVGLGALLPNFAEDNPSRIANGLGGTINAVASLLYIGLTLTLQGPWVFAYLRGGVPEAGPMRLMVLGSVPAWLALQAAMAAVPMAMGLRRWRRIEF